VSLPPFRRYGRRDRPSASDLNRLRQTVEAMGRDRPTSGGGLTAVGRAGSQVLVGTGLDPIFVEILGAPLTGTNEYHSWRQVDDQGDGTFAGTTEGEEGGSDLPAFLPPGWPVPAIGDVVPALPSADGESLILLASPYGAEIIGGPTYVWGPDFFLGPFTGPSFVTFIGAQVTFKIQHVTWGTDQTDFLPDADTMFLVVNLTADVVLKSIAGGADGRPLWIHVKSIGAFTLTLSDEDAAGTAANRLRLPGTAQLFMGQQDGFGVVYDGTDSRWRALDDAPLDQVEHVTWGTDQTVFTPKPNTVLLFVVLTADVILRSLTARPGGKPLFVANRTNPATPHYLTLPNEDAAGTSADRLNLPGGTDLVVGPQAGFGLGYDDTGSRWNALGLPPAAATTFSGAHVYNSTSQVFTGTGGQTYTILFNSELYDTDGYHSTVTNTDRLTIPTTGKYAVGAFVSLSGSNLTGADQVNLTLKVNGTPFAGHQQPPCTSSSPPFCSLTVHTEYLFTAGDVITATIGTSNGPLTANTIGNAPRFWAHKLG
jgi:hypothetical protein